MKVVGETDDGDVYRITLGYRVHWRTHDLGQLPLPLPHPVLLQLHVVCRQMTKLRAAAGWRSECAGSEGGQTVGEDVATGHGGKEGGFDSVVDEEARDCGGEVVALELELREMERRMLWAKKMLGGVEMQGVREWFV